MKNIQSRINKIDKILQDDLLLEKYIENIENEYAQVREDLNQDILKNITKFKKNKKINIVNILKIAACTIFAIGIWQIGFFNNTLSTDDSFSIEKENTFYTNFEEKLANINNIMLSPIRIERGDN